MPLFTVTELAPADFPAAWPLVRAAVPQVDLQSWQQLAGSLSDRGGGTVGVAAEGGPLLGVATYEPIDRKDAGRVMKVGTLVTFELTSRSPVRAILCDAIDRIARLLGCSAVAVSTNSRAYVDRRWEQARSAGSPLDPRYETLFLLDPMLRPVTDARA